MKLFILVAILFSTPAMANRAVQATGAATIQRTCTGGAEFAACSAGAAELSIDGAKSNVGYDCVTNKGGVPVSAPACHTSCLPGDATAASASVNVTCVTQCTVTCGIW